MKNTLLTETIECLKEEGKNPSDVLWVGNRKVCFSWDDFVKIADIQYDGGYGGNEIAGSLLVVGQDFWLKRGEYYGSEWWDYKSFPVKPEVKVVPTSVLNDDYNDDISFEPAKAEGETLSKKLTADIINEPPESFEPEGEDIG